ncbi:sterol desaturase family protein [Pontibacter sp. G13]|uniref:sterol desaturase family protein n=1 Tax=Pontibacter sp. G13 TaxID=3074898 RepID=UPI00288AB98C|nr:sterol desaturase family protein [Pontibacter sp. G13]WNJ17597.1 sterol desaturase family protein [Pontibacter sp. G13]
MKKVASKERPKRTTKKSILGFDLERITRTHSYVPITILSVASIGFLVWGILYTDIAWYAMIGTFAVGMLGFTLLEYSIHRFLYHIQSDSKWLDKVKYTAHGIHHEHPRDEEHLAMPPILSALLTTLVLWGVYQLVGDYSFFFTPGLILGYAAYLFIHYVIHVYRPPKNFLRVLWTHHAVHHYKDDSVNYGVSSPLWDHIFGTLPKKAYKVIKDVQGKRE